MREAPEKREAQRVLAREVTSLVHGDEQVARAEHASQLLFGEDITQLSADDVLAVFSDVPATELAAALFGADGIGVVDLVALVKLAPSKSEARRLVQAGGVYVNNRRTADIQARIRADSGDRRARVHPAEGRQAEPRRENRVWPWKIVVRGGLTARFLYAILSKHSARDTRCWAAEGLLKPNSELCLSPEILPGSSDGISRRSKVSCSSYNRNTDGLGESFASRQKVVDKRKQR